jgi:hypothetical protein
MAASNVSEIESRFAKLSPAIQLALLERLVHRMRESSEFSQDDWEARLTAMAADPEIKRELRRANSEFRVVSNTPTLRILKLGGKIDFHTSWDYKKMRRKRS